jgi:hypothetical protein
MGLIGGTALAPLRAAVDDLPTELVFAAVLAVLFRSKAQLAPWP